MLLNPKRDKEEGSVAIVVAIIMILIIPLLSYVIDVGGTYLERRQEQQAADSAANAVAILCVKTPANCTQTNAQTTAGTFGSPNDNSGVTIVNVCGTFSGLSSCPANPSYSSSHPYRCSGTGTGTYVQVKVKSSGSGYSAIFSSNHVVVPACARSGATQTGILSCPVGGTCLGITVSECEYVAAKNKAGGIVSTLPPYAPAYYPTLRSFETQLNITGALPTGTSCPGLAPGGFGPMIISGGVLAPPVALSNCPGTPATTCYEGDNGNGNGTWDGVGAILYPPSGATKAPGTRFYVPVYTTVHSSGSHQYYGILGFAAFVPTCVDFKHQLPVSGINVNWIAGLACPVMGTLSGFFVSDTLVQATPGGKIFGVTTVSKPNMIP